LFEKYIYILALKIYIFILALLEMSRLGNQHCANGIGTLSFPIIFMPRVWWRALPASADVITPPGCNEQYAWLLLLEGLIQW